MLRLVILLGVVAFCAAKNPAAVATHCCSAEDRHRVQQEWSALWHDTESSKVKVAFAKLILLKLVELKPEAKALFSEVDIEHPDGGKFAAHCMRILNALDQVINMLDHPEAVNEALSHLAHQHHEHEGVRKEYFKTFGQIMIGYGLPRVLDHYDVMSWKSCFKGILTKIAAEVP